MSVIIAYQTTPVTLTSQQRKNGMIALGQQIRAQTNNAEDANGYAAGLATALQDLISASAPSYKVVYQALATGPEFQITGATASGKAVHCDLQGQPNPLIINVRMDNKAAALRMEAVFPRPDERNSYIYAGDAANDLNELNDADAWDYLMTFKFLGRCK